MDFYTEYLRIKPTVFKILKDNPETRDDDMLLIISVWELQDLKETDSYLQFKELFLNGKLAIPETIRRSRAKIQEENVSLRGKLYEKRKYLGLLMTSQIKFDF
ncbi:MAG: hypothetical protein K9G64_09040 [Bacteroidia bacterium]|jgi:hypothetical protein|nr:hypothetical protein [Bacteroidia bacterium]